MPSSNAREPDSLLMLNHRRDHYYTKGGTINDALASNTTEYLTLEYMYPFGVSDVDHPAGAHSSMAADGTGTGYMDMSYGHGRVNTSAISGTNLVEFNVPNEFKNEIPFALGTTNRYIEVALVLFDSATGARHVFPNDTHKAILINDGGTLKFKLLARSDYEYANFLTGTALSSIHWTAGLCFPSVMRTLPLEVSGDGGTSAGRFKRINEYNLKLLESGQFNSGVNEIDRVGDSTFIEGDVTITADNEYDLQQQLVISSQDPTPLSILMMSTEATINR
jgi:hypothetical protein